jgi:hypothetical protein
MVMRGYLERTVSADNEGHARLAPTERGRAAVEVAGAASGRVDAMLEQQLGAGGFEAFQQGLLALAGAVVPGLRSEVRATREGAAYQRPGKAGSEGWTDSD